MQYTYLVDILCVFLYIRSLDGGKHFALETVRRMRGLRALARLCKCAQVLVQYSELTLLVQCCSNERVCVYASVDRS